MARTLEEAESLIKKYEENGPAKLYYSLNRKAWEMADMLNSINMKNIQLDDPKDKTFERMRFIINDSSAVASAVKLLNVELRLTKEDEQMYKDVPLIEQFAEKRS